MIFTGEQVGGPAIRDHDPEPLTSDATGWLRAIALTPLPRRVPRLVRQRRRAAAAAGSDKASIRSPRGLRHRFGKPGESVD
jgi:hypothetical protein